MRTTKRNIINIEPGEEVEIRCNNASIIIGANPDVKTDSAAAELECAIPAGVMMSGFQQHNGRQTDHMGFGHFDSPEEDRGLLLEEINGPLDFIVFSSTLTS